jgi:hypothetical protein
MWILDVIGELGSSFPWIYRGWIFLFSEGYRDSRKKEWKRKGSWYKAIDILLSLSFIVLELMLIYLAWGYASF